MIVRIFNVFFFQAILPYIPQKDPQLSPAVYELVLNTFLQEDCKVSCIRHVVPVLYLLHSWHTFEEGYGIYLSCVCVAFMFGCLMVIFFINQGIYICLHFS